MGFSHISHNRKKGSANILSNAAAGVYYAEVINDQEQTRVKFVIENEKALLYYMAYG